jgi:hypothetical protein
VNRVSSFQIPSKAEDFVSNLAEGLLAFQQGLYAVKLISP